MLDAIRGVAWPPRLRRHFIGGLHLRPFENVPDPWFYVLSMKRETAKRGPLWHSHPICFCFGSIAGGNTVLEDLMFSGSAARRSVCETTREKGCGYR